jgi:hypothetical protein
MTTLMSDAPAAMPSVFREERTSVTRTRITEPPILAIGDGAVVALRHRSVVELGALGVPGPLDGDRLVSARDLADNPWWIPARAVWSDAESDDRPEHPRSVGMSSDRDYARAVLAGVSDRLGWEALQAHEHGEMLPTLDVDDPCTQATVYDGRLGHDVPTVLVIGERFMLWGAGATVASAYRRAMYGDRGSRDATRELADVALVLASAGIEIGVVDLGTSLMRRVGISRLSVQLFAS